MRHKTRNLAIAAGCLAAFLALGYFYYSHWVRSKPFGVILFVSDYFCASGVSAARLYAGGADYRMRVERFPHVALLSLPAADYAVADERAASASLATGRRAAKGAVEALVEGQPSPTLAQLARERGRSVGFVTNGRLASSLFAAMTPRKASEEAGEDLAQRLCSWKGFQVALGGGAADFLPEHKGGLRQDGRDLTLEMRAAGFDVIRSAVELENTPAWRNARLLGLFDEGSLAFADELPRAAAQPSLADLVRRAIELLQVNRGGYFLVVEAGLVGEAARANDGERVLRELVQLDAAVAEASAYAGDKALIVVAGRTAPGGMRLNGFPLRNDKGLALLGTNPQGIPSLTWSTGPGCQREGASPEPSAVADSEAVPAAEDPLVVAAGPGAQAWGGFRSAASLFAMILSQL